MRMFNDMRGDKMHHRHFFIFICTTIIISCFLSTSCMEKIPPWQAGIGESCKQSSECQPNLTCNEDLKVCCQGDVCDQGGDTKDVQSEDMAGDAKPEDMGEDAVSFDMGEDALPQGIKLTSFSFTGGQALIIGATKVLYLSMVTHPLQRTQVITSVNYRLRVGFITAIQGK
jgi:hypothetical protein